MKRWIEIEESKVSGRFFPVLKRERTSGCLEPATSVTIVVSRFPIDYLLKGDAIREALIWALHEKVEFKNGSS